MPSSDCSLRKQKRCKPHLPNPKAFWGGGSSFALCQRLLRRFSRPLFNLKNFHKSFLVLFLLSVSFSLQAETLRLEDCVREATLYNPDLAVARERVSQARAQYHGSYTDFVPQLGLTLSYSAANASGFGIEQGSPGVRQDLAFGPSVRWNLFSGLRSVGGVEKTQHDLRAAEFNLDLVKTQISFDLKNSFYRFLLAEKQLELNQTIVKRRTQNVQLVKLRYEVGRENKGSYLRSAAAEEQAKFDVEQARRGIRIARASLARVLGRPDEDLLAAKGSFQLKPLTPNPSFIELALQTPAYRLAEAQKNSARSSIKINQSGYYPSVDASASFSRNAEQGPDANRWSTGVSLTFPFLNGGRTYFDVQAAKAQFRQAENSLLSTRNQTILDLKQAYSDLQDAVGRLKVQRKSLEASEVRAEIARNQYANGLISFQDWDLIENDLINAQKNILLALYDAVIAQARWEQLQGKGVIP